MLICATFNWKTAGPAPTAAFFFPPLLMNCFSLVPPECKTAPTATVHPFWSAYILIQLFHARAVGGSVSPPRVGLQNGNRHVMINYHYGFTLQLPRPPSPSPVDDDAHCVVREAASTKPPPVNRAGAQMRALFPRGGSRRNKSDASQPFAPEVRFFQIRGAGLKTSRKNQFVTSSLVGLTGENARINTSVLWLSAAAAAAAAGE